ncbi:hypothetical protein ACHHYP_06489, partial [Achlya hypogyna]
MGRPRAEGDRFYDDLDRVLKKLPSRDITVVAGDFNAKLGQREADEGFMGRFCRGYRNANGEALAAFCASHDLKAPLTTPITPEELYSAIKKLRNNRACGPDGMPAEVLKAVADLAAPLAQLLNDGFALGQPIQLGEGTLICLQKPNKPQGVCSSLRPIVLLNCIRKAVSLVVLARIQEKLDRQIGAYQSGFRPARSTADAVWTHKWLVARIRQYQEQFFILGIDFSRAFDTIDRAKLLTVLQGFLNDDEVRLVRMLLTSTTLRLRIGGASHSPFETKA